MSLLVLPVLGLLAGTLPGLARPDVDFLGWRGGASTEYWQQRAELTRNLDQAGPDQRLERRLDLVRFYLANSDGAEAKGLLASFAPNQDAGPDVVLYRGIAAQLQKRPARALEYLSDPRLESSPDARLWRALVYTQLYDWQAAGKLWDGLETILWRYPPAWQARFVAAQIETAFGLAEFDDVERLLNQTADGEVPILDPLASLVFQGRLQEARGDVEAALQSYGKAASGDRAVLGAEARFRSLALQWADGRTDAAIMRARLKDLPSLIDQTRVATEYQHLMAELADQAGETFEALFHLRIARDRAPARGLRRSAQLEIDRMMSRTLGVENVPNLPLINRVRGFYAVLDLLPLGPAGDQIVLAHADRLVALDLLKPAEELLAHQVAVRLEGAYRARAALQLTEIRLARGDLSHAQISLNMAGTSRVGYEHSLRVKLARAKILAGRGDVSGAVAVLEKTDWDPALKLRADLLLRLGRAEEASLSYRRLLTNFSTRGVSPDQVEVISEPQILSSLALADALDGTVAPDGAPARQFVAARFVLPEEPAAQDIDDFTDLDTLRDLTRNW